MHGPVWIHKKGPGAISSGAGSYTSGRLLLEHVSYFRGTGKKNWQCFILPPDLKVMFEGPDPDVPA